MNIHIEKVATFVFFVANIALQNEIGTLVNEVVFELVFVHRSLLFLHVRLAAESTVEYESLLTQFSLMINGCFVIQGFDSNSLLCCHFGLRDPRMLFESKIIHDISKDSAYGLGAYWSIFVFTCLRKASNCVIRASLLFLIRLQWNIDDLVVIFRSRISLFIIWSLDIRVITLRSIIPLSGSFKHRVCPLLQLLLLLF